MHLALMASGLLAQNQAMRGGLIPLDGRGGGDGGSTQHGGETGFERGFGCETRAQLPPCAIAAGRFALGVAVEAERL